DLVRVLEIMRAAELLVVGVLDPSEEAAKAARRAGLGTIHSPARSEATTSKPATAQKRRPRESTEQVGKSGAPNASEAPVRTPTRLITRPVRSGQQIYARGGDLVITSSVSEGAEVLADGHIHIYGALRGRALAGASGDTQARIFCRQFEPDLVAVAGCYKVADAIAENVRGACVQVSLDHDSLLIELQE